MTIRSDNPETWTKLRRDLAGRSVRFVRRECLPDATVCWDVEHLPKVFVSPDMYHALRAAIPMHFSRDVLRGIRAAGGGT